MNPVQYQAMPPPQQWGPPIPANPPPSSTFWNHFNVQHHLKDLHETLFLANSLQKELEMLMKVKEAKEYKDTANDVVDESIDGLKLDEFSKFFEDNKIDLGAQELIAIEAANGLMSKLRFLLEPFRVVTDDGCPWEEKSAAVRLSDKINKSKRNKLWRKRKRKRRRVAELLAKDGEQFEKLDREADEWRAREIAKDMAQQKVEKMKEIAKQKAKEERKKLEAELELALMVEKLQELRTIRIQKLKKQGHFLPEEDDKFLERVRAAAEEEERQTKAAADTDAAKEAIAAAEESRKVTQVAKLDTKDESGKEDDEESLKQGIKNENRLGSLASTSKEFEKQGSDRQSYGAYDYVANLPPEFYHYYHGSNTDMGTLIEVRRTWDAYLRPGGSRIPGHWVQPPPPADDVWASYLVQHR
ncbi:U11/U12 small nuclear ribonucleoprotein 59 kDa protein [Bienertia sinuspersici]